MENKIDYKLIINKSFTLTKENKFLWFFSFFILLGGGGLFFNFSNNEAKYETDQMQYMHLFRKVSFYWESHMEWIILGLILFFILASGLYLLGAIGRASLIASSFSLIKKEKVNFFNGFKKGIEFFWRIIYLNIIFSFSFLIFMLILAIPIFRLITLGAITAGLWMSFLAIVILATMATLFMFLNKYAQLYALTSKVNVLSAINLAYSLLGRNLKKSFILVIVLAFTNIFIALITFVVLLGVGLFMFVLGDLVNVEFVFLGMISALVMAIFIVFIKIFLVTFNQLVWVIFFNSIAKSNDCTTELMDIEDVKGLKKKSIEVTGVI